MNVTFEHPSARPPGRRQVYYWKCDRPAAFHGTQAERQAEAAVIEPQLLRQLKLAWPDREIQLASGCGQGNHLTWIAIVDGERYFVRVENGPERDNQLEVESQVMERVRACGVPTPKIHLVDARREAVPFAWQVMDCIEGHDLNEEFKQGRLRVEDVAFEIGAAIARWQDVDVSGFGHFDPEELRRHQQLRGYYSRYEEYFALNWRKHLSFLEQRRFLSTAEVAEIQQAAAAAWDLLPLAGGCLVHKDLALWNILGSQTGVIAYIDWDDAIAGDELDDLSLLGCFHDGPIIDLAMQGYASGKPLPAEFTGRFWLHLLRNLVVKSVIRVGAGYFDRKDTFFLFGPGMTGADLTQQTRDRLFRVVEGLRSMEPPAQL